MVRRDSQTSRDLRDVVDTTVLVLVVVLVKVIVSRKSRRGGVLVTYLVKSLAPPLQIMEDHSSSSFGDKASALGSYLCLSNFGIDVMRLSVGIR